MTYHLDEMNKIRAKLREVKISADSVRAASRALHNELALTDDPALGQEKRAARLATIELFASFADTVSLFEEAFSDVIPICDDRHDQLLRDISNLKASLAEINSAITAVKGDHEKAKSLFSLIKNNIAAVAVLLSALFAAGFIAHDTINKLSVGHSQASKAKP